MNLLILGASGLVGGEVLQDAISDSRVTRIIAPTRRPLTANAKLQNPIAPELETLLPEAAAWKVDAVICALGTTRKKAGSKEAFRHVDYDLPLAFAKLAHQQGAQTVALTSSRGASADSSFLYMRTKGELERDITAIGYNSTFIARPGLIGGNRNEHRALEHFLLQVTAVLAPVLPQSSRISRASKIAEVLIEAVAAPTPGFRTASSEVFV